MGDEGAVRVVKLGTIYDKDVLKIVQNSDQLRKKLFKKDELINRLQSQLDLLKNVVNNSEDKKALTAKDNQISELQEDLRRGETSRRDLKNAFVLFIKAFDESGLTQGEFDYVDGIMKKNNIVNPSIFVMSKMKIKEEPVTPVDTK